MTTTRKRRWRGERRRKSPVVMLASQASSALAVVTILMVHFDDIDETSGYKSVELGDQLSDDVLMAIKDDPISRRVELSRYI